MENTLTIDDMFNILEDYNVATYDEIRLVTDINGWNEQSMKDILYARMGYRSFDQLLEECKEYREKFLKGENK